MNTLLNDIRYALRLAAKRPDFTAAIVIILAFGIGMITTVFSLVNAILFHPFPYKDAERLVFLLETNPRAGYSGTVSMANFLDWKKQAHAFEDMGLIAGDRAILTSGAEPERLQGIRISSEMSSLLGILPKLGRTFLPAENLPGADREVLISHGFWQRRFGARPDILGQPLTLNGQPHWVVGILPAHLKMGYLLGFEPDYWKPLPISEQLEKRSDRAFLALARLKPGVSNEQAQAGLAFIASQLERRHPESNREWGVLVSDLRGNVDPAVYLFILIAIAAILGIVCVNVTNLLLARASAREREIAIRSALGANRKRLVIQMLTESLLLALLSGGLGAFLSFWSIDLIQVLSAGTNLAIMDAHVDLRVLMVALFVSLLSGVLIGLAPALQFTRLNLNQSLKDSGHNISADTTRNRFKRFLVISEVSLSMMLLVGGGLGMKSLYGLLRLDRGFQAEKVLVAGLPAIPQKQENEIQRGIFFQKVVSRLESRPGIEAVALTSAIPTTAPISPYRIQDHHNASSGEELKARLSAVSPQYFGTLAFALKTGRFFSAKDVSNSLPVAIINEALARKQFESENPVGRQIEVGGIPRTIVGIMGNSRNAPLDLIAIPEIYVPSLQSPRNNMVLVIRTGSSNPLSLAEVVKKEIGAIDPDQLVDDVETMEKALSVNMGVIKMGSSLLGALAMGALLLTAIGIYGVLSFLVSQRTHEFGIRMALGARRRDVLGLVLKQGLIMVTIGIVPGLLASIALGRLLASRIHGLSPIEPMILLGVVFLFLAVALLACYLPARRATRVNPLVALRYE